MEEVKLAIPARPEFVGVVRLAVTSLARSVGFDEDRVDDLKIAVSEACTNAMTAAINSGSTEDISIAWMVGQEAATIEIRGSGGEPAETDPDATSPRHTFSTDLLGALVDGYETGSGPDGSITRLKLAFS